MVVEVRLAVGVLPAVGDGTRVPGVVQPRVEAGVGDGRSVAGARRPEVYGPDNIRKDLGTVEVRWDAREGIREFWEELIVGVNETKRGTYRRRR